MITVDIVDPFTRLDTVDVVDSWTPTANRVTFTPYNYLWHTEQVTYGATPPHTTINIWEPNHA